VDSISGARNLRFNTVKSIACVDVVDLRFKNESKEVNAERESELKERQRGRKQKDKREGASGDFTSAGFLCFGRIRVGGMALMFYL